MASLTLYDVVIPTYERGLNTLDHILDKAEQYAKDKGLDPESFFGARLIDDQNPLAFQVQNATKTIQVTLSRLSGVDIQPFENREATLADLHQRVAAARALVKAAKPDEINARGDVKIEVPLPGQVLHLSVREATFGYGLPNFFFHLNTAYSILRSKGVPLGKADYISSFYGL